MGVLKHRNQVVIYNYPCISLLRKSTHRLCHPKPSSDALETASRVMMNEACKKYNLGQRQETNSAVRKRLRDFSPEWRLDGNEWLESWPYLPPSSSLGPNVISSSSQMPLQTMQMPMWNMQPPGFPTVNAYSSMLRLQQNVSRGPQTVDRSAQTPVCIYI